MIDSCVHECVCIYYVSTGTFGILIVYPLMCSTEEFNIISIIITDQQSSCTAECNPQFHGVQYSVCCDPDSISTFIAVKSSDSSNTVKRYIACPDFIPDWCQSS